MRRVVVAMSGGIDSSVAAYLLKRQGEHVTGVFMRNWDERDETGVCRASQDFADVQRVCERLAMPCQQVDFIKEYWNDVFSTFLDQYKSGHTPNPDILCNQKIKFTTFYNHVMTSLKATAIATGHYAQLHRSNTGVVKLLQSKDTFKDQSYFLCQVPQVSLQNTLFPIGHLTKPQVRELACDAGLEFLTHKKESMGLCFVGKRSFPKFISQYLDSIPGGSFVDLEGRLLGQHQGHHLFTIGQRARIGGHPVAWFVVGKDPVRNTVIVAEGTSHPALFCHSFVTEKPHWIGGVSPEVISRGNTLTCTVRYRHQQTLVRCDVAQQQTGHLLVQCRDTLRAVTPGQCAAFYLGAECLGGAFIRSIGPSLWELKEQ